MGTVVLVKSEIPSIFSSNQKLFWIGTKNNCENKERSIDSVSSYTCLIFTVGITYFMYDGSWVSKQGSRSGAEFWCDWWCFYSIFGERLDWRQSFLWYGSPYPSNSQHVLRWPAGWPTAVQASKIGTNRVRLHVHFPAPKVHSFSPIRWCWGRQVVTNPANY